MSLAQGLLFFGFVAALVFVHRVRAGNEPFHLTTDWSHRHMIFSEPKTLMDRFRFSMEPRYVQQWVRRNSEVREEERRERERERRRWHHGEEDPNLIHGDWNVYLGNVGHLVAGQYPAKFSFDTTVANCGNVTAPTLPDFVVWGNNLTGSTTTSTASDTGTFSARAATNSTITIKNGASTLVLTAAATSTNTSPGVGTFARGAGGSGGTGSATGLAQAIQIAGNGSFVGVSATSAGAVVTIMASTAGSAGNSITLTESTAPASNFTTTFAHLVDGADGVANIAAYDNLYPGVCTTGSVPSSYWGYNTGGTVMTSPVLSFDGKQVAFVQTVGTAAQLVLLKWSSSGSSLASPGALTTQSSAANYHTCTAPCMYTLALNGGTNDTNSSPYYDFANDTIYVGDTPTTPGTTHAFLHKFTGVFLGTPAEVTTGGFPATLGLEAATSPVFDFTNGQVYVTDANNNAATADGGFLYRVDATAGTVVTSARLSRGLGFGEGPIVDASNGTVYVFTADAGIVGCAGTVNDVYQLAVNFGAGTGAVTTAQVSAAATCSTTHILYAGDFDNAYLSSGAGGHMYVCGNLSDTMRPANPTLYQVSVTATGALGAVTTGPNVATAVTTCSPVTEFFNTGTSTDWIYLSVQASAVAGAPINCTAAAGCLMSFNVTPPLTFNTTTATTATVAETGGASGVIIDNSVPTAGDSEIYFTPLSTTATTCSTAASPGVGGCAIQATQSGLL